MNVITYPVIYYSLCEADDIFVLVSFITINEFESWIHKTLFGVRS